MASSTKLNRHSWSRAAKQRKRRLNREELVSCERLEQRLAMAVAAYTQLAGGVVLSSTITLISDQTDGVPDDMYVQVISPAAPGSSAYNPSLLLANNSSFLSYVEVPNLNSFDSVFATNGANAHNVTELGHVQYSDGYPFISPGSYQSEFVLPTGRIDDGLWWIASGRPWTQIRGTVDNGVGGVWTFDNAVVGGTSFVSGQFTPVGTPTGPAPSIASIIARGHVASAGGNGTGQPFFDDAFDLVMQVTWDNNTIGAGGMNELSPPILVDISYDGVDDSGTLPPNIVTLVQGTNILTSSYYNTNFSLPIPQSMWTGSPLAPPALAPGQSFNVVPGTLSGTISINRTLTGASTLIPFTTLFPGSTTLVFNTGTGFAVIGEFDTTGLYSGDDRQVTGTLTHSATGVPQINLIFTHDPSGEGQEVGQVTVDAKYAIFTEGGNFTLSPGQDFSPALTVDMLTPGASISIDSPVLYSGGVSPAGVAKHSIDLRGTDVNINAQVWSNTSLTIRDSQYGLAKAEQAFFNAAVAAQTFDIRLSDDLNTDSIRRSKLFVSTTGSLVGKLPSSAASLPVPCESFYTQIENGDAFIEGVIDAKIQSYIINSRPEFLDPSDPYGAANRAPYYLSTQSQLSGADTGMLMGGTVSITLGNDVPTFYDDALNGGSSAFNVVTIQTTIDSLRIKAADRAGNPVQTPFPYVLTVSEVDDIRIDAVAASSLPLSLTAVKDISFNASLASASDVTVDSLDGNLWLSAPLSTNFGLISLAASKLSVLNSVRVFDTFYDELRNDITLVSRNGDLKLVGPISAVNTIVLEQSQDVNGGRIFGSARVIADRLIFRSEGSVDLRTAVRTLEGTAAGSVTINELDDIDVTSLVVDSGVISLSAQGRDLSVARSNGSKAALRAVLANSSAVVTTAPNGSIDIVLANSATATIGKKTDIAAGKALSMMAAGNVSIVSDGGSIDVLDAPVAGSSAIRVRAISAASLDGIYNQRTPGTFAAVLRANPSSLSSLNALPGVTDENGVTAPVGIDGVSTLRIGDLLLLKDQGNGEENGIYQIVDLGSTSRQWRLVRAAAFDTTAELTVNVIITASEGTTNKGLCYRLDSYRNERSSTPKSVVAIPNKAYGFSDFSTWLDGADEVEIAAHPVVPIEVRAVSTSLLEANFDDVLGTLTSIRDGVVPLFDGVALELNDLVLVRLGSQNDSGVKTFNTNGLYQVSNVGSDQSGWELTAVRDVNPELNPENDFDTGLFVVSEGNLRTRITGNIFALGYNSLGNAPAVFVPVNREIEDGFVAGHEGRPSTQIGSQDVNDVVRLIVSSTGGTNSSAGSLGKMLLLAGLNEYMVEGDEGNSPTSQNQTVGFISKYNGPILLTQELPSITRKLTLDATLPRIEIGSAGLADLTIDGSRISLTSDFLPILSGAQVNGFRVQGHTADGSVLAGIRMGGFGKGAAVQLDGVSDVLVTQMNLGQNFQGNRLANQYGVRLINGSAGLNTVSNSGIYSATIAGVSVGVEGDDNSSSVRLVGNTIGAAKLENAIGVQLVSGQNFIGLNPNTVSLKRVSLTRVISNSVPSLTEFYLPAGYSSASSLYVGLGVVSTRIQADNSDVTASIVGLAAPDSLNRIKVTIAGGEIRAGGLNLIADFGLYSLMSIDSPVIAYPSGVNPADLYIGQTVAGLGINGMATIVSIDPAGGTITLSKNSLADGLNPLVFGTPGRNTISNNNRGVVLGNKTSPNNTVNTINNTDVAGSVYDGIQILGGTAVIGGGVKDRTGVDGRLTAKDLVFSGNAIYGNGSAGIRIMSTAVMADIAIRGNRLGVTMGGSVNINKAGNIIGGTVGSNDVPLAGSSEPVVTGTYTKSSVTGVAAMVKPLKVTIVLEVTNPGVVPGMAVTGAGIVPGTTVKSVGVDGKTIVLSEVTNAEATSTSTLLTFSRQIVTLVDHGLASGAKVWLVLGSQQGRAYVINRVNKDSFSVADAFATGTGTVAVFGYGSKLSRKRSDQLTATGQIDYDGNIHGLSIAPPPPPEPGNGTGNGNGPERRPPVPRRPSV